MNCGSCKACFIKQGKDVENWSPFDKCKCVHCKHVKYNSEHNIWIHVGIGNFDSKETFFAVPENKEIKGFFIQPSARIHNASYLIKSKPAQAIWFSNGSWLYDTYNDSDKANHNDEEDSYKIVEIRSPKNILSVSTVEDVNKFIADYFVNGRINWSKIYDNGNGYWGIAFNFRKLQDLDCSFWSKIIDDKYGWYNSYDVESLCVFDTRAFDDTVTIKTIVI
jgi:hypothetical protein